MLLYSFQKGPGEFEKLKYDFNKEIVVMIPSKMFMIASCTRCSLVLVVFWQVHPTFHYLATLMVLLLYVPQVMEYGLFF